MEPLFTPPADWETAEAFERGLLERFSRFLDESERDPKATYPLTRYEGHLVYFLLVAREERPVLADRLFGFSAAQCVASQARREDPKDFQTPLEVLGVPGLQGRSHVSDDDLLANYRALTTEHGEFWSPRDLVRCAQAFLASTSPPQPRSPVVHAPISEMDALFVLRDWFGFPSAEAVATRLTRARDGSISVPSSASIRKHISD